MRFLISLFSLTLLAIASSAEPIFDGYTSKGWAGAIDSYEFENGVIRCKPDMGGTIYTEKTYTDFIVELEFMLPPGGNNGLAIRYPGEGDPAYSGMCELQVLDNTHAKFNDLDDRQYHGSAYGMVAAKRGHLKPAGEWNHQLVTVEGSTVKVVLNGVTILDADLSEVHSYLADKSHPGKLLKEGHFGFAGHKDPVAYRNIDIKEIRK